MQYEKHEKSQCTRIIVWITRNRQYKVTIYFQSAAYSNTYAILYIYIIIMMMETRYSLYGSSIRFHMCYLLVVFFLFVFCVFFLQSIYVFMYVVGILVTKNFIRLPRNITIVMVECDCNYVFLFIIMHTISYSVVMMISFIWTHDFRFGFYHFFSVFLETTTEWVDFSFKMWESTCF